MNLEDTPSPKSAQKLQVEKAQEKVSKQNSIIQFSSWGALREFLGPCATYFSPSPSEYQAALYLDRPCSNGEEQRFWSSVKRIVYHTSYLRVKHALLPLCPH